MNKVFIFLFLFLLSFQVNASNKEEEFWNLLKGDIFDEYLYKKYGDSTLKIDHHTAQELNNNSRLKEVGGDQRTGMIFYEEVKKTE